MNHRRLANHFKLTDKELLKELLILLKVEGDLDSMSEAALDEFGTLRELFAQTPTDLKRINGFTTTVIKQLKTIYSLFREIIKPPDFALHPLRTYEDLSYFIHTAPKWGAECLRLLYLDADYHILKDFIYKKGSGGHVQFYLREIVSEILRVGVSHIVIIHHKIESCSQPSPPDQHRYKEFMVGFKALDLNLVDYLMIWDHNLYSFHEKKLYSTALRSPPGP
jgi:DNA repair protein RadC